MNLRIDSQMSLTIKGWEAGKLGVLMPGTVVNSLA